MRIIDNDSDKEDKAMAYIKTNKGFISNAPKI